MAVEVIPVGALKRYADNQSRIMLEAGPTVAEIIDRLGIPRAMVALVLADGRRVPKDYRPREGQSIKLIAVMGGG